MRQRVFIGVFLGVAVFGFLFTIIPVIRLFLLQNLKIVQATAMRPDVQAALWLSVFAALTTACMAAIIGIPLAYLLHQDYFYGQSVIEAILDLPLAIPHTVAGIALLFVYGRHGVLGQWLSNFGIYFWGNTLGIITAMLFISLPYMINSAREGFEAVDFRMEQAARTLGAAPWQVFWHISLPMAWRSILTGMLLTYARSLADFGVVIVLTYYPETAPVKIYELFLSGSLEESAAAAMLLLVISFGTFVCLRWLLYRRRKDSYERQKSFS